jgi:two-component system, NtrC family, sensor kinase
MLKFGLRGKLYLGLFLLLFFFSLVIFSVVARIMRDALLEENRNRGVSIAANLAARAVEPILAIDFLRLKNLVDEITFLNDDISYGFILGTDGEVLVHTFKGGFPVEMKSANVVENHQQFSSRLLDSGEELIYDYAAPVVIGEERVGTVRVGLLRTRVETAISRLFRIAFLITGLLTLVTGFVGAVLANSVTRRIKLLQKSAEKVVRGDLDTHTAPALKENCWEVMHCDNTPCRAYGNFHHRCWYLAGTLCANCIPGDYANKIDTCRHCSVYKNSAGDEIRSLAESFDYMTLSLKERMQELQDAERTMREHRMLLKTILDATPEFVYLQDRQGKYQAVNRAFCHLLGKEEDQIVGRFDQDLYQPDIAGRNFEENKEVLQSGIPLEKQEYIESGSGHRWCHVMRMPVRNPEGVISGILWSGRDITALKEMEARLVQARKMESVGQLAAGIAHEINTPLAIILGYAQVLLEEIPEDDQRHQDLEIINRQGMICRKIVADLLKFSRSSGSTYSFFDLNEVIVEVVSVMEHTFNLDRVRITCQLDPLLPGFLGARDKFKQVLVNLLNNAHDAIGTDGMICISVSFDAASREIGLTVSDTGQGIPLEDQGRIFDPFFTTKPVDKGTGLGLSVTYGIIHEHGGRITVESPPGADHVCGTTTDRGAAFVIHLPTWIAATNSRILEN